MSAPNERPANQLPHLTHAKGRDSRTHANSRRIGRPIGAAELPLRKKVKKKKSEEEGHRSVSPGHGLRSSSTLHVFRAGVSICSCHRADVTHNMKNR